MFNFNEGPERLTKPPPDRSKISVGARKMTLRSFLINHNALLILILLIIGSAIWSPIFLSSNNIVNILRQQVSFLLVGVGILIVMLTGGIDLSVASIVGLGSVLLTEFVAMNDLPLIPAILITLLACAALGAINGFLVAFLKMAPFIVTLAMSFAGLGLVFIVTGGAFRMLTGSDPLIPGFIEFGMANDPVFGIPWRVYVSAFIVIIFWLIMAYTSFGRMTKAVGSNPAAVSLAGIDIRKYQFLAYVICAFLSGLAGILVTAGAGSSAPTTAQGDWAMTSIAAVIIGGGSISGGKGTVPYTVVGIFIMAVIGNIMNLASVPAHPQWVVRAIVIILAIFLRSVIASKDSR
ncbi:MAG: ABC transporter permease [Oscillospiraceae bacterium]|nr:ABC transporter permease [Oscillospiraceae bacterium]